jgi:hypothetical protein
MSRHRDLARAAVVVVVLALGCSDATSASFASLRFTEQPVGTVAGQPIGFTVEFVDAAGARATAVNDDVIVAVGSGEAATGARTVVARNGVAVIDDFVVTMAADNHVLSATAGDLSVVSLPFAVTAGVANGARSSVVPSSDESLLANTPRTIVFTFADEYGNPLRRAEVSVASDLSGATLSPAAGKTTDQGTFLTTYRPPVVGSANFSAVVNGRSITFSAPLAILSACTPKQVTIPATMMGTLVREQGCLIAGAPFQFFQFTTATSSGLSLTVDTEFGAEFEVRGDPAIPNVRLVAPDTIVDRQYLLPAGSYELRIGAFASQGRYTMTAATSPANRGDTVRILVAPGTYTGQALAPGDFVNSIDGFTDSYVIHSARPCTITVRSAAFDPFIVLTNTFGISVGFDDNSGGGTDAQITRSSCTSIGGAIRIDLASTDNRGTGPYTLIITYN